MATNIDEATKANPLKAQANPHAYRDPAKRGKIQGQKAKAGKTYKGNPYTKGGNAYKSWKDSFDAYAN